MSDSPILYQSEDNVGHIIFNRPDVLNSLNQPMHDQLRQFLNEAAATVRAVVISGEGRAFCAGQDLADIGETPLGDIIERDYNPLIKLITELPLPVIAAVNGVAAGAGANIALAADIVIAAEDARFIQSFTNIGLVPDSGGTWILPRLIGFSRAKALCMSGEAVNAKQAEQWGMIWRTVPTDQLRAEALTLAKALALKPTWALAQTKAAFWQSANHSLGQQLEIEKTLQNQAAQTADYQEGIAAFKAKRQPHFIGR